MIEEAYCNPEIAELLKEKEMDKECFTHYIQKNNSDGTSEAVTTCTQQRAMRWLREIHHIIFVFKPSCFSGDECTYWTYELWCGDNFEGEILSFKTYEQAVEAALKHVLEHLI